MKKSPASSSSLKPATDNLKSHRQDANNKGVLYVVATPIGNLQDFSPRACETLAQVSKIAAEDTRRTRQLLAHWQINTPCFSLHEHNERQKIEQIVSMLERGESIALVCDAGTPLISDPGYPLVSRLRELHFDVIPIPGPCALIAALSVCGLPSEAFVFSGFLPAKSAARRAVLESFRQQTATMIFYESTHRITDCLNDLMAVFGESRRGVIARELTKTFETILDDSLAGLHQTLLNDAQQRKGEFVLLIAGADKKSLQQSTQAERLALMLSEHLPIKQAAKIAADFFQQKKNAIYQFLLTHR